MQSRLHESVAKENSTATEVFESLAYPLLDTLYNTAAKLTGNPLDAEDLVRHTCLKALRHFHKFAPGTNFKAWIFRILLDHFSHEYRRNQREPAQTRSADSGATMRETIEGPSDAASAAGQGAVEENQGLLADKIRTALERLPVSYRTVVLLSDVNEFKYQEIADLLDCPIETVMSRLSRARCLLTRSLKELTPSAKTG